MFLFLRWLIVAFTILMLPSLVSGIEVANFGTALAASAILGVLNLLVKPLLVLLTLPLTLLSLGLFLLVINALIFQFAGALVTGLVVHSFGAAFFASLIVSLVSWATNWNAGLRIQTLRRPPAGPRRGPAPGETFEMHQTQDGKWE